MFKTEKVFNSSLGSQKIIMRSQKIMLDRYYCTKHTVVENTRKVKIIYPLGIISRLNPAGKEGGGGASF